MKRSANGYALVCIPSECVWGSKNINGGPTWTVSVQAEFQIIGALELLYLYFKNYLQAHNLLKKYFLFKYNGRSKYHILISCWSHTEDFCHFHATVKDIGLWIKKNICVA